MNPTEKEYYPQTIVDQPMLTMQTAQPTTTQQTSNGVTAPAVIQEQPPPAKKIAQELLSTVLDTKAKKILAAFQFSQSGSLQIGKFVAGVSGDIKISPLGIVARDNTGENTFSLDADSGDGTFKGKLAAGSLVGADGNFVVEEASDGGARLVIYNDGIRSIIIGDPS